MDQEFSLPTSKEDTDYYITEYSQCFVAIEVCVNAYTESESPEEIECRAVDGYRNGKLDGNAELMHTESIRSVELDWHTNLPFDRAAWVAAKLLELGVDATGRPLRPGERTRPECETTLLDFVGHMSWWERLCAWIKRGVWSVVTIHRDQSVYNYDMEKRLNEEPAWWRQ